MQVVDVKVKNVKSGCMLADAIEHQHIIGNWIYDMGVETQCEGGATHQPRGRYGIATSKQRDIVSELDELLCEIRYDAFGATVKPRWNALHQRRYLSDLHFSVSLWKNELSANEAVFRFTQAEDPFYETSLDSSLINISIWI